jgi:Family of unknown function (DUF5681)
MRALWMPARSTRNTGLAQVALRRGNPRGASRKHPSIAPDLKALLERALNKKVTLRQGEKEHIITKAEAGIEQLVNQFARGDRHARRDLFDLAGKLGVDLTMGRGGAIEKAVDAALAAEDEALLADYMQRHGGEQDQPRDNFDADPPQPERHANTGPGERDTQ